MQILRDLHSNLIIEKTNQLAKQEKNFRKKSAKSLMRMDAWRKRKQLSHERRKDLEPNSSDIIVTY